MDAAANPKDDVVFSLMKPLADDDGWVYFHPSLGSGKRYWVICGRGQMGDFVVDVLEDV